MIDFFKQLSPFQIAILSVLLISFIIQMVYYWRVFGRVAFFKYHKKAKYKAFRPEDDGVSIIVYSNNELASLEKNIPLIMRQKYPKFEVVVLIDGYDDDSDIVMRGMSSTYSNLEVRIISHMQNESFDTKSVALNVGIRAAKYDCLLFTGANCRPLNDQWLTTMQAKFDVKYKVVVGYTKYTNVSDFVKYDMFFKNLHMLGMAACGRAYAADGKNMMFSKQLFLSKGGYDYRSAFDNRDDILIINKISNSKNTGIEISHNAIIQSSQKFVWDNWLQERAKINNSYKLKGSKNHNPALWEMISRIAFYVSLVLVAINSLIFLIIAASFFLLRFISMIIVFSCAQKQLEEQYLIGGMLLYDLYSPFVNLQTKLFGIRK